MPWITSISATRSFLGDVSIDYANINGLKIFGVEISPLLEAELARKRGD
jgi:hypothetical protein